MTQLSQNTGFVCVHCTHTILPLTNGSYRNHCPFCLYSLHLDIHPGDRLNGCQGLMRPIGLVYKSKKGLQIRHRCIKCGHEKVCLVATDTVQPDNYRSLALLNGLS